MSIQYYGQGAIADKVDELNLLMEFPEVRDIAMGATNTFNPDLNVDKKVRIEGTQEDKAQTVSRLRTLLEANFGLDDFDWKLELVDDDHFRISLEPVKNIGLIEGEDIVRDEQYEVPKLAPREQRESEAQIANKVVEDEKINISGETVPVIEDETDIKEDERLAEIADEMKKTVEDGEFSYDPIDVDEKKEPDRSGGLDIIKTLRVDLSEPSDRSVELHEVVLDEDSDVDLQDYFGSDVDRFSESIETEFETGSDAQRKDGGKMSLSSMMRDVEPTSMKKVLSPINIEIHEIAQAPKEQIASLDARDQKIDGQGEFDPKTFVDTLIKNADMLEKMKSCVDGKEEISEAEIHSLRGIASNFLSLYENYITLSDKDESEQGVYAQMDKRHVDRGLMGEADLSYIVNMDNEILKLSDSDVERQLRLAKDFKDTFVLAKRATNEKTLMPVSESSRDYYIKKLEMEGKELQRENFASNLVLDGQTRADIDRIIGQA